MDKAVLLAVKVVLLADKAIPLAVKAIPLADKAIPLANNRPRRPLMLAMAVIRGQLANLIHHRAR